MKKTLLWLPHRGICVPSTGSTTESPVVPRCWRQWKNPTAPPEVCWWGSLTSSSTERGLLPHTQTCKWPYLWALIFFYISGTHLYNTVPVPVSHWLQLCNSVPFPVSHWLQLCRNLVCLDSFLPLSRSLMLYLDNVGLVHFVIRFFPPAFNPAITGLTNAFKSHCAVLHVWKKNTSVKA